MIIIKTYDWGDFEGADLKQAKNKFVNAIVNSTSNPDISIKIDEIDYHGDLLAACFVKNIAIDIEYEVKKWYKTAKIESEGLRRAQQESMEG
ncbi:MAG: hypothetical protein WCJ58_00850 [bacterium]